MRKKSLTAILMAAVVLVMGACGQKFDYTGYVESCLDAQFKGEYKEYVKLTESTEEEAKALYEEGLETFADIFDEFSLTEEQMEEARQLSADILKTARYTVKEAKEDGDTTIVTVEVEPMKCFENYEEEMVTLGTEYAAELQERVLGGEEMPDEEALMQEMYKLVYDDLADRIKNTEYGDKQTFEVEVTKDSKNVYTANEDNLAEIAVAAFGL